MSFEGWGYRFEGPFPLPDYLSAKPGVFIVWCVSDGIWDILDAGEADNVKYFLLAIDHLKDHDINNIYQIYFSAANVENSKARVQLLKTIKGPSFHPCDVEALKKKDGLPSHTKHFDSQRVGWKIRQLLSKMIKVPSIPRRVARGFEEKMEELRITKK